MVELQAKHFHKPKQLALTLIRWVGYCPGRGKRSIVRSIDSRQIFVQVGAGLKRRRSHGADECGELPCTAVARHHCIVIDGLSAQTAARGPRVPESAPDPRPGGRVVVNLKTRTKVFGYHGQRKFTPQNLYARERRVRRIGPCQQDTAALWIWFRFEADYLHQTPPVTVMLRSPSRRTGISFSPVRMRPSEVRLPIASVRLNADTNTVSTPGTASSTS